ncbi:hypothetical protein NBM50_17320, partial [Xylophilus ampelinus]|nr:hypothetical protein [Xylophilus ampelinus]
GGTELRRWAWTSADLIGWQVLRFRLETAVSWFNHHRLLEPIGYIPPAEAEANYHRQLASQATALVA